jgi:hypothetical protein
MIALMVSAQNKKNVKYQFKQVQEKMAKVNDRLALLTKNSDGLAFYEKSFLKNAATKQKLDSIVRRELNLETQVWHNADKDEFTYNSELKNTIWLSKEWEVNIKAWENRSKTELIYDNQNRVKSMTMSMSMESGQPLRLTSKFVNFYNSQGLQDSTLSYSTEDAGVKWILDMKQINHYNASKQLIKVDVWALDENAGVLKLSMKVIHTYTASGKIKSSSTNYTIEGQEMLYSKTEYNYDTSEKLTSVEYSDLNFMTFVVEKSHRTAYQYNASGDVSVDIYSDWNGTAWEEKEKDENIYSTINFSEVAFPVYYIFYGVDEKNDIAFNKQITGVNNFQKIDGIWKNTEKMVFYYSAGTSTGIDETNNTLFTAYPNPASEQVNFIWKENYENLSLEMYQITGAKVMEQTTYPGKPVSISRLENGVYFFKLLNGKQMVHTGKIVKR